MKRYTLNGFESVVDLTPYPRPETLSEEEKAAATDTLLKFLLRERGMIAAFSASPERKRALVRGYMNERPAHPIPADIITVQDRLFWTESVEKGIVDAASFRYDEHGLALWEGDITRLGIDGIVNAANSGMLGCFLPNHNCIDNVIHSAAGMQLRDDCAKIIADQGRGEETGDCKLTRAFNLPSRYVLHTVGPMIRREVGEAERAQLRSCYYSCLDVAERAGLGAVAFCCISTGVFNFPRAEAAEIAVGAVLKWKMRHKESGLRVVFNTFLEEDTAIYRNILSMV